MKVQSTLPVLAFAFASFCACAGPEGGDGVTTGVGATGNENGVGATGNENGGSTDATSGAGTAAGIDDVASSGGTSTTGGTSTDENGTPVTGGISPTGGASPTGGQTTSGDTDAGATGTGVVADAGEPPEVPVVCGPPESSPTTAPIQFNDNGGWNWHLDERAVVDPVGNKLIIGSIPSGGPRTGFAEAVVYDLATNTGTRQTLGTGLSNNTDDHNAPAFVVRSDGSYLALWSSHRTDCFSRHSIFDGSTWSDEVLFDWGALGCPWPGAATNLVTYANPWYMDGTLYVAFRTVDSSPAFLSSPDEGETWSYYGRLTSTEQIGYVAGYYKYWGNNTDRIDFCGTEAHPRDFDNNLWHGYVQNGSVYNSFGEVVNAELRDADSNTTDSADIAEFTPVFTSGSSVGGVGLVHAWNLDMVRYDDGSIVILGQGREQSTCGTEAGYGNTNCDPDKRIVYFRFDGTSWQGSYLVKAGPKLYETEEDYIGGGSVHPNDPHTIFVSTTFDPRDDTTQTPFREIYQGTTCDDGATWQWTPITQNSTADNIRPIVPKWDRTHTALVWMRGSYDTAQIYSMEIVGLISEHAEGQVSWQ